MRFPSAGLDAINTFCCFLYLLWSEMIDELSSRRGPLDSWGGSPAPVISTNITQTHTHNDHTLIHTPAFAFSKHFHGYKDMIKKYISNYICQGPTVPRETTFKFIISRFLFWSAPNHTHSYTSVSWISLVVKIRSMNLHKNVEKNTLTHCVPGSDPHRNWVFSWQTQPPFTKFPPSCPTNKLHKQTQMNTQPSCWS